MKHKMFVIFDSKANAYMQPWFLTQDGMALRAFSDCVNDKDHNFGRHPEDYTLFTIGEFDDQTAQVEWITPQTMGNGIAYLKPEMDNDQLEMFSRLEKLENLEHKLNGEENETT